jgi:DNA-binding IclR family transcriptional regulator
MIETAARNQSSSLRRALTILSYVEREVGGAGATLTEIADALSLNKSTVLRLAEPLVDAELLARDAASGRFRLGLGALQLGQAYLSTLDIRTVAATQLRALQRSSGQTCHLVVPDGLEAVYIDKVESEANVRMASRVGRRVPLYRTGVGKAMLAFAGDAQLAAVLDAGLDAATAYTITEPDALRRELARIRQCGYAIDGQENEPDVRCVAAPLFDHEDRVVGAVSVSGLASRMTAAQVRRLAPEVVAAAHQISAALGHR